MKVDGGLGLSSNIDKIVANAKAQEAAGYDGVWTAEPSHDPFLPLVLAAEHTERLELGTSIAVPSSSRSGFAAATTRGRNGSWLGSAVQTPS